MLLHIQEHTFKISQVSTLPLFFFQIYVNLLDFFINKGKKILIIITKIILLSLKKLSIFKFEKIIHF